MYAFGDCWCGGCNEPRKYIGGMTVTEEMIPTEMTIGVNAGKVYQALSKLGVATPLLLKNEARLSQDDVFGALGWLAREGKLMELREGKLVKFKLNE